MYLLTLVNYSFKLTFPTAIFSLLIFSSLFLFAEHGNDPITFVCFAENRKVFNPKPITSLRCRGGTVATSQGLPVFWGSRLWDWRVLRIDC